jgi:hypothetical protein
MLARWNKKLLGEEKLAKIEDQKKKKKKKKRERERERGRNHSEKRENKRWKRAG